MRQRLVVTLTEEQHEPDIQMQARYSTHAIPERPLMFIHVVTRRDRLDSSCPGQEATMDRSMFQQLHCSVAVHDIAHCIMMYIRRRMAWLPLRAFAMHSKTGHINAVVSFIVTIV